MRVKVNETWYNAQETPICVDFGEEDRKYIDSMVKGAAKYAAAPDEHFKSDDDFKSWMKE